MMAQEMKSALNSVRSPRSHETLREPVVAYGLTSAPRLVFARVGCPDASRASSTAFHAGLLCVFGRQTLIRCGGGPCAHECATSPDTMPSHIT